MVEKEKKRTTILNGSAGIHGLLFIEHHCREQKSNFKKLKPIAVE